jgi:two-component system sensor histidine kinase UhpB
VLADYYERVDRERISAIIMSVLMILFSLMVVLILLHRRRTAEKFVEEEKRYQRKLTEQIILTQEKEREVIGHELHDNVNQVLTTVKLYLEMAQNQKETRDEMIPKSIELVMTSINEIRNLSRDLSAPTLGTKSLVDSVTALVEMVSCSTGLSMFFEHSAYREPVSMNQTLALYRILQEQLNNVIKHAAAKNVWITLLQQDGKTILKVKDDGKGFDPLAKRAGIGLNNMASRVNLFYGQLSIQSSPGKGCTVEVSMPSESETGKGS